MNVKRTAKPVPKTRGIRAFVLEYANRHPGLQLFAAEMAEESGYTKEQITNAMSNVGSAKEREGTDLGSFTSVVKGTIYTYKPPTNGRVNSRPLFEQIGVTRDGARLLEGEDGTFLFGYEEQRRINN